MHFSLFRTFSLRHLKLRWSRALMVVASITLGVATIVATRTLNQSMESAMQTTARPLAGMTDLVVSNADVGVRLDLAPEVAKVPGVRAVMPLLVERVVLPDLNRPAVLIAADVSLLNKSVGANPWGIEIDIPNKNKLKALFQGKQLVLVGTHLAESLQRELPEGSTTFRMRARGETLAVPMFLGTIEAKGAAAALGGDTIFMHAEVAGQRLGKPGMVSRLDVTLDPGLDLEKVRAEIKTVLKDRAVVKTPQEFDKFNHDSISALQLGFSFCGAGALVVGLFLVYNVLSVSVTERRHEIGILRAIGATRPQVCGLFLAEACVLGLIGATVGLPLGLGLAYLGLGPVQRVFNDLIARTDSAMVTAGPDTLLLAAAAGLLTAGLAAWIPARKASKEQPANAVRRNPPPADFAHLVLHVASGGSLVLAGIVCMLLRNVLPLRWGNYGFLACVILGLMLLTPFFATILAQGLRAVVRRFLGIESRLAADNLVRSPSRTGLVITALAAGVGMVLQTAGIIRSNKDVIMEWLDASILADLIVSSGSPVSGGGQSALMKESVGQEILKSNPDVEYAMPVRFRELDFRGKEVYLIALEAGDHYKVAKRSGLPVPGLDLFQRLAEPGTARAIVSDNFAALYHVAPGDHVELAGPDGPIAVEVIGTAEDYTWNFGTIMVDRVFYKESFKDSLADVFNVHVKPGGDAGAVREDVLRRWGVEHALVVLTRAELHGHVEDVIKRLYNIAYSQEIVMALVAALGVVTALLISVIQRRHEIGVLRALGATRTQVLRSILAEAALMGLIGTFIGMLVGVPIEWYVLQVILFEEAGFRFAVSVPWREAIVIGYAALGVATLAGLIPAVHTLRLRIPEAIAYE